jgi:hypothetical protein
MSHVDFNQSEREAHIVIHRPAREVFIDTMAMAAIKGAILRLNDLPIEGDIVVNIELLPAKPHQTETKAAERFAAFVRPTQASDEFMWQELGSDYPDEYSAKQAVARAVGKYGLRCLFRWEGNLYRCSPKDTGVWGRIEKV